MADVSELLSDLVPQLYEAVRDGQGMPRTAAVAGGNLCHLLTRELFVVLDSRGVECRRELHRTESGMWHFVIAHAGVEARPCQKDVITDLNPWQFKQDNSGGSYLHGERLWLQVQLLEAGAPAEFAALRGIATIVEAHRTDLMPDGLDYIPFK